MSTLTFAATHIAPSCTAPRGARAPRRAATVRASAGDHVDPASGPDVQVIADSPAKPWVTSSVSRRRALGVSAAAAAAAFLDASWRPALAEFEKPLLEHALRETEGNQVRAAQLLGINRNTLRKKISDLAIEPDRYARRR